MFRDNLSVPSSRVTTLEDGTDRLFQNIGINPLAPELFFLISAHLYIKCE